MDAAISVLTDVIRGLVPEAPSWPALVAAMLVFGLIATGVLARLIFWFQQRAG